MKVSRIIRFGIFAAALLVVIASFSYENFAKASVESPGVEFDFTLSRDEFHVRIHLAFDHSVGLREVIKTLSDPKLMAGFSEVISDAYTENAQVTGPLSRKFRLVTVGEQMKIIHVPVAADCVSSSNASHWEQSCVMNLQVAMTGTLFRSGSSKISCDSSGDQVICDVFSDGRSKDVGFRFYKRTAQRLAVSGAAENLVEFGSAALMLNNRYSAQEAKSRYPESSVGLMQAAFSDQGYRLVDQDPKILAKVIQGSKVRAQGAALEGEKARIWVKLEP